MSMVHGAIAALAQGGPFIVTRRPLGTWADGEYTPSASATTIEIEKLSIQPIKGEDVSDLEEAIRGDELMMVFSTTRLVGRRRLAADPEVEPDIITDAPGATDKILSGENWKVVSVKHWKAFGGYHCEAVIARMKR